MFFSMKCKIGWQTNSGVKVKLIWGPREFWFCLGVSIGDSISIKLLSGLMEFEGTFLGFFEGTVS